MMLRNVLSYYFKNILYLLLFAVVPAVFLGLLIHPFSLIEMLFDYPNLQSYGFGAFFQSVYGLGAIGILWYVLGFLILIVCISFLLGKIELHFRTGNFDLSSHNVRSLNNNFGGVALVGFVLFLADFLLNIIAMLLMFFVHFIISADGSVTVASTILNWIIGIVVVLAEGFLTSVFVFAAIDKIIMGSPFSVALSNSFANFSRKRFQKMLVAMFPFAVGIVLTVLGALLHVVWLSNILSLLFIIPYVCVFGMTSFFEFYDMPRYDNRKYYNLK